MSTFKFKPYNDHEVIIEVTELSKLEKENQKLKQHLDEAVKVIEYYSNSTDYHYGEYWKYGVCYFSPPLICVDSGEVAKEFLEKLKEKANEL